ncbi:MAG: Mur ligase family protein [Thermodesulfovibrionales bacterium]|nr:Mur ligase family protein [Thermodesulfovibrionales bacterium]
MQKKEGLKLFFSGIGGSGMSAIAAFMAKKGNFVKGSDRAFDLNPDCSLLRLLKKQGIEILKQDGRGISRDIDYVIFSTAIEKNNPDYIKAQSERLNIKSRPEFLIDIALNYQTIGVAGTSGKSTTAGLLAFLLKKLDLDPNLIGGGIIKNLKSEFELGNFLCGKSDLMIIEVCESDGTITNYFPTHSVLLNLAFDHHDIKTTANLFQVYLKNTKEKKFLNRDDSNLKSLYQQEAIYFSIESDSDYKAENIYYMPFSSTFNVRGTKFHLSLPGKHNIYNALAAISVLSEMGISLKDIAFYLPQFKGIERRFDILLNTEKCLVIDDFAHNPHKIQNLMETVSRLKDSICYIFQPHGFAPTRLMKQEYINTFTNYLRKSDHLYILPIYYAGGTTVKDISHNDLALAIEKNGKSAKAASRKAILSNIGEWRNYVVFGARDNSLATFAKEIAHLLMS